MGKHGGEWVGGAERVRASVKVWVGGGGGAESMLSATMCLRAPFIWWGMLSTMYM